MFSSPLTVDVDLLGDLLEASDCLYHRNVAVIQRVFADQFFQALGERRAADASFRDEELLPYRHALKAKLAALIHEQRELRHTRDTNARAYVAARAVVPAAAA